MAVLQGGPIDTNEYNRSIPQGTPLPPGLYQGVVTRTEQKPTAGKNGNPGGIMVEVEFDITAPEEYASSNRKVWDSFNVVNASAEAVRIAKEGISDLGKACGYAVLEDDEQLLGCEVIMRIAIDPAKPYTDKQGVQREGKPKNKILKYWAVGTDVEAAEAAAKAAAKTAPAAQTAAAPQVAAKPVATAPSGASKWQKPATQAAAAPAQQQAPAQAATPRPAAAAASGGAPWKKNAQ